MLLFVELNLQFFAIKCKDKNHLSILHAMTFHFCSFRSYFYCAYYSYPESLCQMTYCFNYKFEKYGQAQLSCREKNLIVYFIRNSDLKKIIVEEKKELLKLCIFVDIFRLEFGLGLAKK